MDQIVIVQMSLCLENLVTILTLNVILGVNTIHMLCQMVFCNKNLTTLITSFLFFAMTSHMSVEVGRCWEILAAFGALVTVKNPSIVVQPEKHFNMTSGKDINKTIKIL